MPRRSQPTLVSAPLPLRSADAGVYLEKLFKAVQLPLWLQSIQLSIFALPISCLCMLVYDWRAMLAGHLLIGFNGWAWLTVALSALGGIAVSMALKCAPPPQCDAYECWRQAHALARCALRLPHRSPASTSEWVADGRSKVS